MYNVCVRAPLPGAVGSWPGAKWQLVFIPPETKDQR